MTQAPTTVSGVGHLALLCYYNLPQQLPGPGERFPQPAHIFSATPGVIRAAAAFASNQGGDGLDDLAGLNLFGQLWRHGCQKSDRAIGRAPEHDDSLKLAF